VAYLTLLGQISRHGWVTEELSSELLALMLQNAGFHTPADEFMDNGGLIRSFNESPKLSFDPYAWKRDEPHQ
jgi:hypothetical protein